MFLLNHVLSIGNERCMGERKMRYKREIAPDICWVGGNDRRLALFENMFPLPDGVAYNSYLILDDKTALIDTVDSAITRQFFENIDATLNGRALDYAIVNHMEPDHCANLEELARRFPDLKIVGNQKTFQMIRQFYSFDFSSRFLEVKEGDELPLGRHTLRFYFAPMVHWPEVMLTYEKTQGILFSADAFGSFGAHSGNLFCDEVDFARDYLPEARRYYTNIVGKYGPQVQAALHKLAGVEISMICPLHGLIWRDSLPCIINLYDCWSRYKPEEKGVVLAYASMYGNTENAVDVIADKLADRGVNKLRVYDVSKTHASYIIADMYRMSHIVLASSTYNGGLYFAMEALLHEIKALRLQNRTVAIAGNGSWSPAAGREMIKHLKAMKNMRLVSQPLELRSALRDEQMEQIDSLVDALYSSL